MAAAPIVTANAARVAAGDRGDAGGRVAMLEEERAGMPLPLPPSRTDLYAVTPYLPAACNIAPPSAELMAAAAAGRGGGEGSGGGRLAAARLALAISYTPTTAAGDITRLRSPLPTPAQFAATVVDAVSTALASPPPVPAGVTLPPPPPRPSAHAPPPAAAARPAAAELRPRTPPGLPLPLLVGAALRAAGSSGGMSTAAGRVPAAHQQQAMESAVDDLAAAADALRSTNAVLADGRATLASRQAELAALRAGYAASVGVAADWLYTLLAHADGATPPSPATAAAVSALVRDFQAALLSPPPPPPPPPVTPAPITPAATPHTSSPTKRSVRFADDVAGRGGDADDAASDALLPRPPARLPPGTLMAAVLADAMGQLPGDDVDALVALARSRAATAPLRPPPPRPHI